MYDIPEDLEETLKNCHGEINQVCFGPYDIQIICGNYKLQTSSCYEYKTKNNTISGQADKKEGRDVFLNCIGHDLKNIKRVNNRSIALHISNGDIIILIADTQEYECLCLELPDGSIVVA